MRIFRSVVFPSLFPPLILAVSAVTLGAAVPRLTGQPSSLSEPPPVAGAESRARRAYGELPVVFEANKGQMDSKVSFAARSRDYALLLTPGEAVMSFPARSGQPAAAVRMAVVGANPAAAPVGVTKLEGVVNDLRGNDADRWRTGVPTYGRVAYNDVLAGTDLVFHSQRGQLEYDFVVAPGADPGAITLALSGADGLSLDKVGNLVLATTAGTLRHNKPVVYQQFGDSRRAVPAGFVLKGADRVGFRVGAYDTTRPLVIDPILAYDYTLGGTGTDVVNAVAVAGSGASANAFVTGETTSTDFPTSAPSGTAYDTSSNGGIDTFVTKLNSAGTGTVYSTYLGGSDDDSGYDIAVSGTGSAAEAYVTGQTKSTNFPTSGAAQSTNGSTSPATSDAFFTKLNSGGTGTVYSTYLGGTGDDSSYGIAVDGSGKAYVAGLVGSRENNFPTTNLAWDTQRICPTAGVPDPGIPANECNFPTAFVAKFDPASTGASSLLYSTYLGEGYLGYVSAHAIAVDSDGNAYVTGGTSAPPGDFPVTPTAFQAANLQGGDAFVVKLNTTGQALLYSTFLGGTDNDYARGIAVDTALPSPRAYVVGTTSSANFLPVAASRLTAYDSSFAGGGVDANSDAFVAVVDPGIAGPASLAYATYLGGSDDDFGKAIGLNIAADVPPVPHCIVCSVFVTGQTGSTASASGGYPATTTGGSFTAAGAAFLTRISILSTLPTVPPILVPLATYSVRLDKDGGNGVAVEGGRAYVGGGDGGDGFVAKVSP